MSGDQQREAVARALFLSEMDPVTPEVGEDMWGRILARHPETEWHKQADRFLAALAALAPVQPTAWTVTTTQEGPAHVRLEYAGRPILTGYVHPEPPAPVQPFPLIAPAVDPLNPTPETEDFDA
ncbi:hypothetical protein [Cellulomonas rhizosphaerae]|uniref:Uncharacterized protein n=1 Tax=Cellulomonas rhizosphaerae TaxID=2293719 RepID=A0A413RJF2_9CELL|nr:hypothetical protein [Cellulomonas rhizosphaerae]RHA38709.1 hypothetical protein D1825_13325 [Cellulomonas rhizosphaerae]